MIRNIAHFVAEYLKKENPNSYTGHSFRSSSATEFINNGGTMENLKRFGDWSSSNCAEGYLRQSRKLMMDNANILIKGKSDLEKRKKKEKKKNHKKIKMIFNYCTIEKIKN